MTSHHIGSWYITSLLKHNILIFKIEKSKTLCCRNLNNKINTIKKLFTYLMWDYFFLVYVYYIIFMVFLKYYVTYTQLLLK